MKSIFLTLLTVIFCLSTNLFGQDQQAKITLSFRAEDSLKFCTAKVISSDTACKAVEVKFYAKRLFSNLLLGSVQTDDSGIAEFSVPADLPGDSAGAILMIAKIEDDSRYGSLEAQGNVQSSVKLKESSEEDFNKRSLSASREKAPMYLIFVANTIIVGVWGVLFFIFFQLYRIRKYSKFAIK